MGRNERRATIDALEDAAHQIDRGLDALRSAVDRLLPAEQSSRRDLIEEMEACGRMDDAEAAKTRLLKALAVYCGDAEVSTAIDRVLYGEQFGIRRITGGARRRC